jgi:ADP-heptose:LPS heptosyltransferase
MPTRILVIKTGALGDVIRTTSILPGLARRYPDLALTWVTAHAARDLVEGHPNIDLVQTVSPKDAHEVSLLQAELAPIHWDRVLSFDDELPLCQLAGALTCGCLSGAFIDEQGERAYTDDVAPWFEMGLLARDGKQAADQRKIDNTRTHPEIFADMLGIEPGRPALALPESALAGAGEFAAAMELDAGRPLIGLNTGAGGRWRTKELPIERVVELARLISERLSGGCSFLVLGGPEERERNQELLAGLRALEPKVRAVDGGSDNSLLDFAARIGLVDLLVSSDSMALHMGIALERPIVCFFAPTSAAEIELYGLGEKVWSSAPDYCSYRPDADNSSLTAELLCAKVVEVLGR